MDIKNNDSNDEESNDEESNDESEIESIGESIGESIAESIAESEENEEKNELYILLKSFNRLDNYIAKYIYLKYIEPGISHSNDASTLEMKYKYNRKPSNQEEYKKYIHKIFKLERPSIITQKQSLEIELHKMEIADKEYEEYEEDDKKEKSKKFIKTKQNSYPDIYKCSFIRKHKNKYKRCSNRIVNDNSDMCYKHIESPNIYWDRWCKVLQESVKVKV